MYLVTASQTLRAKCGLVLGIVFGGFLLSTLINPCINYDFFRTTLLGFTLTEATALFPSMVTVLIFFS